jgi:hypothetical protein
MGLSSTQIKVQIDVIPTRSLTYTTVAPRVTALFEQTMAEGTTADKANICHSNRYSITDSSTPTAIDLSGSLTDPLGNAAVFVEVTTLFIYNRHATSILTVGADAAPWATFLGGTNPTVKIGPGGCFFIHRPDATGYAVTGTTADILQVATDAGTSVPFDIMIVGRNA